MKIVYINSLRVATQSRECKEKSSGIVGLKQVSYTRSMCLAVPALVKRIEGSMADAELGGVMTTVNVLFTPDVQVGDYVIMHAGYAISVMDAAEAEATFELLEKVTGTDAEQ